MQQTNGSANYHFKPGEICIWTDILEREKEVTFIRRSEEAVTALVQDGEREIWVRLTQITPTGKMKQEESADAAAPKSNRWTWGDTPPEHLIKQPKTKTRRK